MPRVARALLGLLAAAGLFACSPDSRSNAEPETATNAVLRWGGDAEGGAPFVEADPSNPAVVRGFDVDVATVLATGLGRRPQFAQVAYASIAQSVDRGDFDVGLSGLEDRPALRARYALSIPYFEFREVLAVRPRDAARFRSLADLRGKRVATLGATLAYELLLEAEQTYGIVAVSYDDDVHPYSDLAAGRVDAVVLDHILAARSLERIGGFVIQPTTLAVGHYVAVFAHDRGALRDSANRILAAGMADGTLERIYRRWGIWDTAQARFFATQGAATGTVAGARTSDAPPARTLTARSALRDYGPALLRGAGITLLISCVAMLLAMSLGTGIAAGRVYGGRALRTCLGTFVEVMRGTPVLLQLFVLYYGLSDIIRLPALVAAMLGLGLNYAAYESEIYRSALLAIPTAQLEAARTLGLSEWQIFRLVRGPQALRFALAPMTNDFVALLKDSSLVSVITVVELTKQTSIFAVNAGSWAIPGTLCALLYLAMSLPLSRMARRLESRWSAL